MSRRTGQLRATETAIGALLLVGAPAVVIALCVWLLLPTEQLPSLDAPSQAEVDVPTEVTCDDRLAAAARARTSSSGALPVDSTVLIECPDTFDGRVVEYRGEAVGAVLRRGPRAWAQLNDDVYALVAGPLPAHRQSVGGNSGMAVSLPAPVAADLVVGGADWRGDVLTVRGPYRRAAVEDGEGPSILAEAVTDITPGVAVEPPVSRRRVLTAALLIGVTAALATVRIRRAVR